jgi:hypothetical protein
MKQVVVAVGLLLSTAFPTAVACALTGPNAAIQAILYDGANRARVPYDELQSLFVRMATSDQFPNSSCRDLAEAAISMEEISTIDAANKQ